MLHTAGINQVSGYRSGTASGGCCRDKSSLVVFVTWYSWDPAVCLSIETCMTGTCSQGSSERTRQGSGKGTCERKRKECSRGKRDQGKTGITINTPHHGHYDHYVSLWDNDWFWICKQVGPQKELCCTQPGLIKYQGIAAVPPPAAAVETKVPLWCLSLGILEILLFVCLLKNWNHDQHSTPWSLWPLWITMGQWLILDL